MEWINATKELPSHGGTFSLRVWDCPESGTFDMDDNDKEYFYINGYECYDFEGIYWLKED